MIDHMNLPVSNLGRSRPFYEAILECLNYRCIAEDGDAIGFGGDCWRFGIELTLGEITRIHIAFRVASISNVDQFFSVAMDYGGRANGEPGLRPRYGANYYAAFVLDPDGHNIEAVYRGDGA